MAQVHLFCDESGKVHSSDYTSFCAFMGLDQQWQKLLAGWRALRLELQVPAIHVSAILHPTEKNGWMAVKDRWKDEYVQKCDEMLDRFASVIFDSEVVALGAVVDAKSFRDMSLPELKKDTYNDPHYLAFSVVVMRALALITWADKEGTLGLLVDDDEEKAFHCYQLLNSLKLHSPEVKDRVSGICFVSDHIYPGIQGADMFAHEARRLMTNQLPASERFLRMTRKGTYQPFLFGAERLQEMENDLAKEKN